jgi:starch-binding outer membrane protein, SusD/RagB family
MTFMKFKYIVTCFSILVMTLSSCKKQLDLLDPQGLEPQTALTGDVNIKKVLQGGYDAMSSGNLYGGNIQLLSDLLASDGELTWVGTFNNYREVWGKNMITTNSLVTGLWTSAYNVINVANSVLDSVGGVVAADQNRVKGEALFLRASMHFELVRFFALDYRATNGPASPGIPVMKVPTFSLPQVTKPARNTVAEVYTSVIEDLVLAETLLPASNGVFATKAAAAAILSRVYLQKGDYINARDAANRGIVSATGAGKTLLPSFMANFNQAANTAEDIFAMQVSDQDGANALQVYYSVDIFGGRDGDIEVNSKHLSLYETGDLRRSSTNNPSAANQFAFNTAFYVKYGASRTTKWRDLYKNVKVIRLAELYLTRAEANYRLATSVGDSPLNDLNKIHSTNRTGLSPYAAITSLNQVYLERRRELAFEGFGIHDARRFARLVDTDSPNAEFFVFPIPFRELNANPSLVQNPGY